MSDQAEIQKMLHDKDEDVQRIYDRALAAEARVTELEAALETIWRMHDIPIGGESYSASMREVARAALAKEDTDD